MGIRAKTLFAVTAAVVCLAGVLLAISTTVLLGGYAHAERQEMVDETEAANAALRNSLDALASTARDWASWDDTYAFMGDGNQAYIDSNLTAETLENLGLSYILYFDDTGRLAYGAGLDEGEMGLTEIPPEVSGESSEVRLLLARGDDDPGMEGIVALPQGTMLAASQPILTSSRWGPFRGTLVMMRSLDEAEVGALSRLTLLSIELRPLGEPGLPDDFRRAVPRLAGEGSVYVHPLDGGRVAAYSLLEDVAGEPVLVMRVDSGRFIYGQGLSTIYSFTWMLLAITLAFGALTAVLLERLVVRRLARLDADIGEITRSGDPAMRVSARGGDEISRLAHAINGMLEELRRSQEDLKASEVRYRRLVEKAPDTICTISVPDGTVTSLNPAFEELTGWSREEWIGRDLVPLFHPEDAEKARRNFMEIAEGMTTPPYELRLLARWGDYVTGEIISAPITRNGKVEGVLGIVRDVTGRKKTQERLEKLNRCLIGLGAEPAENMRMIVEAGMDMLGGALAEYRRSPHGERPMRARRPGWGVTREDVAGAAHARYDVLVEGEEKRLVEREASRVGSPGQGVEADGCSFPVSLGHPVHLEGKEIGYLRVYFDKEREFEREEVEMMGILARAISIEEERHLREESLKDFLDIASHELRHPITVMKGYALILKDKREVIDAESENEMLEVIDRGADRLNSLIEDLLDVSRIERGKFRLRRERQPVAPLIERALEEMRARGFGNEFSSRVRGDLDGYRVDGERFAQLLVILLENAVKYSPPGAPVEIETEEGEEGLTVSVLDRGIGVPEEERERVFDRFHQVEEVAHHSTPGMGMGLYIARNIVAGHGGVIGCEPRPGGGSMFRFTIPRGKG